MRRFFDGKVKKRECEENGTGLLTGHVGRLGRVSTSVGSGYVFEIQIQTGQGLKIRKWHFRMCSSYSL